MAFMDSGLEKIKANIFTGNNQQNQSSNASDKVKDGAEQAKDYCGTPNAENTAQQISNAIDNNDMQKLSQGIQDMQRQVGMSQAQKAVQMIQNGIQQAHNDINNADSLKAGQDAISGLKQIQSGLQTGSMQQASKGLQQVQNATQQMQNANKNQSQQANNGIKSMQDGASLMQSALNNMSNKKLDANDNKNDNGNSAVDSMQNGLSDMQNQQNQQDQQGQGQPQGQPSSGQGSQGQGSQVQGSQVQGTHSGQGQGAGQTNSNIRQTNSKLNAGADSMSSALEQIGKQGQGQGQGQSQGQGQGQGQDPNRDDSGNPKNPFAAAQQKGQQGNGGVNGPKTTINGQGNGQGNDTGLDTTPGTVGQGESMMGSEGGSGISGGFSRGSYSTEKKSGFADTTKLDKKAEEQQLIGAPKYGDNDFVSGKANVDQNLTKEVTVSYNGKKLSGTVNMDILSNHDKLHQQAGGSATEKRIEESKMALQNIKTKIELEKQKNDKLDKDNAGRGANRFVEFGLETNMSWKKLLRKCLQKERRGSSYSYLQPNRRYSNMGMTVVSRVKDKKVDVIKNIKVCVDTSGSVSPEELNLYLSQIARLTKEFENVEAELLYWSNAVTDVGEFKNIEDLKRIHVGSTGGTDVRCVFEYLNGETKVNGKLEKHKPKEMAAVVIITDGCFYNNYEDYAKIFGHPAHKVIWMIEGNAMDFKPPFGNVVQITRQGD